MTPIDLPENTAQPATAASNRPCTVLRSSPFRIITRVTDRKQSVKSAETVMRIADLPAEVADPSRTENPLAVVDGWPINLANLDDAVAAIISAAKAGTSFSAVTLNLDHIVKLRSNAAFRAAYRQASFTTADGAPVAKLARRQAPEIVRTTGADLVVPLTIAAAEAGLPVYLFGTRPGIIAEAGADLAERTDGLLNIVGSASPAHDFDPEGPEADAAIDRIAASGAKLCYVALGAPKQEIFSARAVARGINCGFVNIGAALDFLAGAQVRAPEAFQNTGMEWLWRLAGSPRRFASRYVSCAVVLTDIILLGPQSPVTSAHRTLK